MFMHGLGYGITRGVPYINRVVGIDANISLMFALKSMSWLEVLVK